MAEVDQRRLRGEKAVEHLKNMTGQDDWQFDYKANECVLKHAEGVNSRDLTEAVNRDFPMDRYPGVNTFQSDGELGIIKCDVSHPFLLQEQQSMDESKRSKMREAFSPEGQVQRAALQHEMKAPEAAHTYGARVYVANQHTENSQSAPGVNDAQEKGDAFVNMLVALAKLHEQRKLSDAQFAALATALLEPLSEHGTHEQGMRRFAERHQDTPGLLETLAVSLAGTIAEIAGAVVASIGTLTGKQKETHAADNYYRETVVQGTVIREIDTHDNAAALAGKAPENNFIGELTDKMQGFLAGGSGQYNFDVQTTPDGKLNMVLSDKNHDRKMTFQANDTEQAIDTFREVGMQTASKKQSLEGNDAGLVGGIELKELSNLHNALGGIIAGLQGVTNAAAGASNTTARADGYSKAVISRTV